MITRLKIFELNSTPSYGYRAGDLERKAETLQKFRGGRGTGHFGTGFYFFGDIEQAEQYAKPISARYNTQTNEPSRPITRVDFNKYKMFRIHNRDFGFKFHDTLKEINQTGFWSIKRKSIKRLWDDENSTGDDYKDISAKIEKLIERRNKKATELLEYIKCPKNVWNKEFSVSDVKEAYDLIKNYVYYKSSKSITDGEIEIEDKINNFISYTEKDKELDGVNWMANKNKINEFLNKYKSKIESDKNKISKYAKEEIRKLANKLALMISNMEYVNQFDKPDNPNRNIDEITTIIEKTISKNLRQDPYNTAKWNDDTRSTKIMKDLGYEGIDVRGVNGLDNSMFGSVIYDIKHE
jgi:hypothetical protein